MSEGVSNGPDLEELSAEQKRALLARLLARKQAGATAPPAPPQRYPLSPAQRRLWFIDRLQPGQIAYNIPAALRLQGRLDVAALERALNAVIARHDVLRARFPDDEGEPWQDIAPALAIPLERIDAHGSPAIAQRLRALAGQPFDLARGPLLRVQLLRTGEAASPDDEHVLLLCLHHIVADYWSLRVLMKEIALLYSAGARGGDALLAPLPIQYTDYAVWQQSRESALAGELDYWRTQLSALPPPLALPCDRPRLPVQSTAGARLDFTLDAGLSETLRALAKSRQCSVFTTLLAALQLLLHRYTGQDDLCVGSTVSNRERAETRDLIGLFVNNLVLRARFDPAQRFTDLLAQVRDTALAAFAHQALPFEQLVDALKVERRLDRHPLFQIMFVLHNTPPQSVSLPGLKLSAIQADTSSTRFDLGLDMVDGDGPLRGTFEFSSDLFDDATIARMARHFENLLTAIAARPDALIGDFDMLSADERAALCQYRGANADTPRDVAGMLAAALRDHVDAVALDCEGENEALTYRALHERAARLMHALRAQGVSTGARLALCLPRGIDLVPALIACLRMGVAYVPLDIRQPAARLHDMMRDAGVALALAASPDLAFAAALPCAVFDVDAQRDLLAAQPEHADDAPLDGDTPAYVIYTSGTTGRPKGVPVTQRALANLLASMAHAPGMQAGDALLAVTTIAFDIAALELLLPLCVGARVVLASHDTAQDGAQLAAALATHRITHMQATPATWRLLVDAGWRDAAPGRALVMLSGGEALDTALARTLLERGGALWNMYGPTETTIWSAALRIDDALLARSTGALPVGGPIAHTWLAVVDAALRPLPPGIPGELLIGGDGLSPGYVDRAELTAEKFIELRDADGRTLRAYRTGDRVRRRTDGLIEFLGRVDHQIKLRGFRIEPGDIEAAASAHPAVAQCLAGLWSSADDTAADAQLVLWFRPHAGDDTQIAAQISAQISDLRAHLARRLPAYMQPGALVALDAFPLTPNGKIDRRALPPPGAATQAVPGRPPRDGSETKLATIWNTLLPQPVPDADADFFTLGGHSLLAARMAARVRTAFGTELPLRAVFEHPTLAALAAHLDALGDTPPPVDIAPADRSVPLPLSPAQHRQWVLAQLEPGSPFYNIPAALRVRGPLDVARLRDALRRLCARHENLRTLYPTVEGEATLQVLGDLAPVIEHTDLSHGDAATRESRARDALREFARRPFDLSQAPLLRVATFRLGDNEHRVVLVLHHILADAWSMNVLMRDLAALYAGDDARLPVLRLQYADYAAWQRTQDSRAGLDWWREHLAGAPVLLDLPTDYLRPAAQSFAGGSVRLRIDARRRQALEALGRRHGATPFMTLLALFKLLLARYSGTQDIVVGTPVGHRPNAALDDVIGLFANTLALRTDLSGVARFDDLLVRVRDGALAGFAQQHVPFDQVLDALDVPRNWAHAPLFQVMFLWQAADAARSGDSRAGGLSWSPLPLDADTTKFDLTLSMAEDGDGLSGRIDYRRDLFRPETMAFMADAFSTLIDAVLDGPARPLDALPLAGTSQRAQLARWNDTAFDHPRDLLLQTPFEARTSLQPDAEALIDGHDRIGYRELDRRANALALRLRALGVGPEVPVGVCLRRNADLIVALLATLKAGGAYVPLDPAYPPARLALILDDARPRVLLTHADGGNADLARDAQAAGVATLFLDREATAQADTGPAALALPASTAYVIYTSGSTGRPKGVAIEHRQAVAMLVWAQRSFDRVRLDGVLAATSVCFDLSVFEIFVPLAAGGRVILADNVLALPELPAAGEVTLINTVPTAAAELLRLGALPPSVTTVNVAGEPVPLALVDKLYAEPSVSRVYNLYGPSEDTTYSTEALLARPVAGERATIVPIGLPIANTRAHVLDEHLQPVAIGMAGELLLGGEGVARGYWARPDLTAERFVPNPFADGVHDRDSVLYRTGDRVRRRADGSIEFLGRIDQQVKIRGFRIETGDIEAALERHDAVRQTVVGAWTDEAGNKRLAAWVVPAAPPAPDGLARELRAHLQQALPDFMLPSAFVLLDALPRLPNGKVDRGNLPRPQPDTTTVAGDIAPRRGTEALLADIWCTVLGRAQIGVDDNFFELGGDSIMAIQAVARARQAGLGISPRDLFQHATVAALAAHADAAGHHLAAPRAPVHGEMPLTPVQHAFFEQGLTHPAHWNQSLLLDVAMPLDDALLARAAAALADHHEVLRARFEQRDGRWQQHFDASAATPAVIVVREQTHDVAATIRHHAEAAQAAFDLARAPLWALVHFDLDGPAGPVRRLFIAVHHLLIDGVSWRILLEDLQTVYGQLAAGTEARLPPRSASARDWVATLERRLDTHTAELDYWQQQAQPGTPLPRDFTGGDNRMRDVATVSVQLPAHDTQRLLQALPAAYKVRADELLITALALTLAPWTGARTLQLALEGHGRADLDGIDLSRTVGWFTTLYPVRLQITAGADTDTAIKQVKAALRAVPQQGLGYGVLRHLSPASPPALAAAPEVRFNYLGQTDALFPAQGAFSPASEATGRTRHPDDARDVLFDLNALVSRGELQLHWSYSAALHRESTVRMLAQQFIDTLRALIDHCLSHDTDGGHIPADFPQMQLDADELDALLDSL